MVGISALRHAENRLLSKAWQRLLRTAIDDDPLRRALRRVQPIAQPNSGWTGGHPGAGGSRVTRFFGGPLPVGRLTRQELRAFCHDPAHSVEACFVACMAWGGMNRAHGRDAWSERAKWVPIVEGMRVGELCRVEAYRRFHAAAIKGLGPAYYTKLIFFTRLEPDGFILDQWTG